MESAIAKSAIVNESAAYLLGQISSGKSFDGIESVDIIKSLFDIKNGNMSSMDITNALANSLPSQQQDEIRDLLQNDSVSGPIWWFTTTKLFLVSFNKEISSKGNYLSLTLMVRENDGVSIQVRKLAEFNSERVTFMDRRLRSIEFSPVICDVLETIHNDAIASLEEKLLKPETPKPQEPDPVPPKKEKKMTIDYNINTDINPLKIRRLERLFRKNAIIDVENKLISNLEEINSIIEDSPGLCKVTTKVVECVESEDKLTFKIDVMRYIKSEEAKLPEESEEPKVEEVKVEEVSESEDNRPLFSTEFKFLSDDYDELSDVEDKDAIIQHVGSVLDRTVPMTDGDAFAISNQLNDPEAFRDDGSVLNYIVTWCEDPDSKMGKFTVVISRIFPDFMKIKNINLLRKVYKEFDVLCNHIEWFNKKFATLNDPDIVSADLKAFEDSIAIIDHQDALEILKTNFKEMYDTYTENHRHVVEWLVSVNENKNIPQDTEDYDTSEETSEPTPSTSNEETMENNEVVETTVDTSTESNVRPKYEIVVDESLDDIYETIVHAFTDIYDKSGITDIDKRLSDMIEMDLHVDCIDDTHFSICEVKAEVDNTPGADIHDVNVQHGLLRGIFGVIDPAVTHVQKFLHKHLTEEQNPGYLSTGTYPTETMIVWNEKPYNFTMSIIKFKNGRYYRIYLAVTDPSLDDPSWLATRYMHDRWIQIGRDVQSNEFAPSFQGRRPRYN